MNLLILKIFSHYCITECSLNCAPGQCIQTNSPQQPHACLCGGTIQFNSCTGH